MKIGILTFHRALNYGAFLQAFALKTYLERLGNDVEIIDYWPSYHQEAYKSFKWGKIKSASFFVKIKILIATILGFGRIKKRMDKMKKIQKDYLHISESIQYPSLSTFNELSVDYIFYGSDQIWWKSRTNGNSFDGAFFGEGVSSSIRKISYAASMGVIDLNNADALFIKEHLANFSSISVRENDLKEVIQCLTQKKVQTVLDPVFLINKKIWEEHSSSYNTPSSYILLFNITQSREAKEVAFRKSKEQNMQIIEITPSVQPLKFGKKCLQTLDAFEFISFIRNADFVITSSFHCTAFSIIFEKQFITTGMGNNSARVKSLLDITNIQDRYVENASNLPKAEIDFSKCKKCLETHILDSKKYILDSLQ